jgi:hypothetical protein
MDGVHTISNNAVGAESPGLTGITGLTINRILARYSDASANLANNIAIENLRALGGVFDSSNIALYGSSRTQEALTNELTYKNTPMATPSGLGWRFGTSDNDPWKMPTGSGYPILYWQP